MTTVILLMLSILALVAGHLSAADGVDTIRLPSSDDDSPDRCWPRCFKHGKATEEARPWKCCDDILCNVSAHPTCQCRDMVKKCAKACKYCEKADESDGVSSYYVCRDFYFGWSPKCTKSVAAADDSLQAP